MTQQDAAALIARATKWAAADPDPATQAELRDLLAQVERGENGALEDLSSRFDGPLTFGTAGLRARIEAGESRMNIAVVRRAAAGIARFLTAKADGEWTPRVVIGHDARYRSHDFAVDSARVFTAAGFEVLLMPEALPTPVLSWAVRALDADAGVMVTASHNPKWDNGYKVYVGGSIEPGDGRGAQIVPPVDTEIAQAIRWDEPFEDIALADGGWTVLPAAGAEGDVEQQYVSDVVGLSPAPDASAPARDLRLVTTAMHGVGGHTLAAVLRQAGYADVHVVQEQEQPDPDFPTVEFPNPEEKGAIDLAVALAERVDADLVVANDPDADRCSAAIPTPDGWRQLRGDEVGVLLGEHVLDRAVADGVTNPVLANSIVSSRQLSALCAARGVEHEATLTGFKWIARVPGLVFGYEEALGYCVAPELTHDKDGISATVVLAELAQGLKHRGSSVLEALDAAAVRDGVYLTEQVAIRVAELSERDVLLGRLLSSTPAALGGSPVVAAENMEDGLDGLAPTAGLRLLLEDNTRVIVRPSGTEPKLKSYLEVIEPVSGAGDLARARAAAAEKIAAVKADLAAAMGL
ncbi:phospho-sugar mutase [Galactobacter sp.]|uniref:phospho-sugar mutase n=1 Tax=Galactobacter sp. TaxID=2676125 RepID=UPI0025BBB204|nr:phospho-sugar mutase [Galactobacter sp.]